MESILVDISSPSRVAQAIEDNTVAYWASHCGPAGVEMRRQADRLWIRSGQSCTITNCIMWTDFPTEEADRRIEEVLDLFRPQRLPLIWWIGPSTRPADLGARLLAHGLRCGGEEPGMAVELSRLPLDEPRPAGLSIVPVERALALRRWVGAYVAGFGMPAHWRRALLDWEAGRGEEGATRRHYLGLLWGRAVATAQLVLGGGVAGLYGLSTIPRARGRGIGRAMTLFAMQQGQALGYRVGVLYAAEMGRPLYRRLGFREYIVARDYVWEE